VSLYWWFTPGTTTPEPAVVTEAPVTSGEASAAVSEEPVAIALPDDTLAADIEAGAADPEPEPLAEFESSSESVPPPPEMGIADVSLSISYSGDCWTEITDATGRRMFFELGRAGRSVNLTGEAPVSVLFGDADNVSLSVNGASYPISARDRRGQTARLTILAP